MVVIQGGAGVAGVSLLGSRFTAPLGNLTGSVKTTTSGMSGKLTLAID